MPLLEHRPANVLLIESIGSEGVRIQGEWYKRGIALTPARMIPEWAVDAFEQLSVEALDLLLQQQPDVILLGTGSRLRFPAPALRAHVLRQGIGFEVMDNAAAARTYNVLISEGRNVVLALLIDR